MSEWAAALDAHILLHENDREWVRRPDPAIRFWQGETLPLHDGITLIIGAGHYPGGSLLHWPAGAAGKGVLLSGDIIQVNADRKSTSFMYSYPNWIPLGPRAVRRLAAAVAPFAFDRIYGAFPTREILTGAKRVVQFSVDRHLKAIEEG
ncbi:MAG: hypothetical protein SFV54_23735 [Bryobacteraceae bacterium]|nr:hypothetical protein [Bryobacteraceae bacterium]